MKILILGGTKSLARQAIVAAVVNLNIEILNAPTTLEVKLRPQEISMGICELCPEIAYQDTVQNTYGPAKKGRGGKVKKW